ncbi:MAG: hypothetical protein F6K39_40460, partial [Okeania sp. SIO3B3]|nr:hypothetical protein [Okeania sp. SIO3B3]
FRLWWKEGRRQEAGGRRFSPIVTLILYTNDATGHDITAVFIWVDHGRDVPWNVPTRFCL